MVKCSDCGFLATRNRETSSLDGMEQNYRNTGEPPRKVGFAPPYDLYDPPICLMQAYDLWNEIGKVMSENVRLTVHKDRDCTSFTVWKQGASPKEHREMIDRQWLIDFQAKREEADRQWRDDQRKEDLKWREEQENKASKRHRWDLIITGGIATLILAGATIIAAFITRGTNR